MVMLRTQAKTPAAIVGNHMLELAEELIREMRVKPHLRDDARQEAALAALEQRDPEQAVRKFADDDRCLGMTGGGTRPTVERLTPNEMERLHDGLLLVSGDIPPSDATEAQTDAAEKALDIAAALLVRMNRRQRKIIRLVGMGWTYDEVAQHIGSTPKSISKFVSRLRSRSATMLRGHSPNDS